MPRQQPTANWYTNSDGDNEYHYILKWSLPVRMNVREVLQDTFGNIYQVPGRDRDCVFEMDFGDGSRREVVVHASTGSGLQSTGKFKVYTQRLPEDPDDRGDAQDLVDRMGDQWADAFENTLGMDYEVVSERDPVTFRSHGVELTLHDGSILSLGNEKWEYTEGQERRDADDTIRFRPVYEDEEFDGDIEGPGGILASAESVALRYDLAHHTPEEYLAES